ncbi:amino acid ABC transporter substrate-binding protein [Alteromonas sp. ASW11-19]|uniref:Amino acid ABC transporter substrate-binding protein n=1 Tax=Alteromonas salexigens TaxID=2982530 RepID=A0ABT2VMI2_9ALTE|nr:amino acid ABC transporter substrate-binding protein [Alteromonas salexigens]MCU7553678.1 amino acid ABC transporter substrate-binding protein [Alteromonas salexigens]
MRWAVGVTVIICHCLLASVSAHQDTDAPTIKQIRIPQVAEGTDPLYLYVKALLQMALDKTAEEYGEAELLPNESRTVQERQLRNLDHKMLDVTWSVTTLERESLYTAVPVPIAAGLFGKRVLLIRADDERFDEPVEINQLKQYRAVQGQDWPDTRLYRHHGFSVLEATYKSSFRVLEESFADYYPRGVLEVDYELAFHSARPFALEEHLVLSYPSPMFFFVSRNNRQLAERINEGLQQLLATGEFQALLMSQRFYQNSMAHLQGREVINLTNPMLSEASQEALDTYLPYFNQ